MTGGRPKIVLLGMMSRHPVGGVIWQTLHYLVGFERLGFEIYYVEAHAAMPTKLMASSSDDAYARAAELIDGVLRRFDLAGRWAFHAIYPEGRCYGMSESRLRALYGSAALIVNLHGGTLPLPEHSATGRLVYLETDPVQVQVQLHDARADAAEFLEAHCALFTFAENYASPDCRLPRCERFRFLPTRQPVVADLWEDAGGGAPRAFTTVGNWRQRWRDVCFQGEVYTWSKHFEFLKFLDVPSRTGAAFELALGSYTDEDRRLLESKGWRVRPAGDLNRDIDAYRRFIAGSRGEFTVAKDQNVRLRTGWFSDRSATYLAAGRPVVTQETGFSNVLPTGSGLFGFSTLGDVERALGAIESDYERHCRAARALAVEYFNYDVVLRRLLQDVGVG